MPGLATKWAGRSCRAVPTSFLFLEQTFLKQKTGRGDPAWPPVLRLRLFSFHSSFENDRSQNNISERDIPMISLKHERAPLPLAAFQSASGNTWNLLVVYHGLAVQNDRDIAAKQRDVVGLPLSRTPGGVFGRI